MAGDTSSMNDLHRTRALGDEAVAFLNTPLGQRIQEKAQEQVDAALRELKEADPEAAKNIATIQRRIHRAEDAVNWILEVINEADEADYVLQDSEE